MSGTTRQPRIRLTVGGKPVPGLKSVEVQTNSYRRANSFRAVLAVNADPATYATATALDGNNRPLLAEVQASLDAGASWTSLLIGRADRFRLDPITGTLDLDGRDRTADLIEGKTQQSFRNQTSSEVVTTVAGLVGMTPDVTPTGTPTGRYYESDHDKLTLGQFAQATNYWDLIGNLARDEGFDAWVDGNTLRFHPLPTGMETPGLTVAVGQVQGYRTLDTATGLTLERDLTLARDIQVDVHSWSSKAKSGFTISYKATGGKSAAVQTVSKQVGQNTQRYQVTRPNLTRDQALQLAQRLVQDISRQERRATVEMPGELVLTPRSVIRFAGTGTDFDQVYFVGEVTRRISADGGFKQTLQLKNTSPRTSQVTEA